ncbi:HEAT repeat domain-containing protein [Virgibacillus siamensis]|uniref:HEAT repeat domain-containing protein n=1 Tax=Virgibacillus siamensis TaxID=480071 RepID=UPI000985331E|nr:HEAT repeat domain-containing protein [Virgibacillus siamensis]
MQIIKDWEKAFYNSIKTNNLARGLDVLNSQISSHRKTPKTSIKSKSINIIKDYYGYDKELIFEFATHYINYNDYTADEISTKLLAFSYPVNTTKVNHALHRLADSKDWEVREWAAGACGEILSGYFNDFYPTMISWTNDESPNVRRAVIIAAKYTAKTKDEKYAEPLLDLIENLLTDSDSYVKNNLGPFAIGDGLLRCYPQQVLSRLDEWVKIENDHVKWNIAKIFSTAEGAKYYKTARKLLNDLEKDDSHIVRRGVKSAKHQLRKRLPETIDI